MPKIKKQFYPWSKLISDCLSLAKKLKNRKFSAKGLPRRVKAGESSADWDFVVAISRGGLIPATLLAYLLKIKKLGTISYSHYLGDGIIGKLVLILPPSVDIKNSRVLLVDDKADTGETLLAAKNLLAKKKNKITTATLHFDPKSKIKPDFFANKVKNIWIVYPWEPRAKS